MKEGQRFPKLLGRDPDLDLDGNGISTKIQENFKNELEQNHTLLDIHKSSTSLLKESRLIKLNSEDIYEISPNGAIIAIKSNESIFSGESSKSKRPKSGRFHQSRPWSNRSYKRTDSGSVGSRPGSSTKKIFSVAKSHSVNSKRMGNNPMHKSHLSKVDQIIKQTNIYTNPGDRNEKITRKYNKLRSHESLDSNKALIQKNLIRAQKQRASRKNSISQRNTSGNRSNSLIRIVKNISVKFINGVSVSILTNLFHAKCNDLKIEPKEGQLKRFLDYCQKAMKGRKITFREIGFGPHSAKILGHILRYNKVSHLDLRKNVLGDQGLKELSKSLLSNSSIIHLDIGSNDVTFEGANKFFKSMVKHQTLTSISIANSDGLHRNRIRAKGCIGLNTLIKKNKLISMLNLSGNNIGKEGVKALLKDLDPKEMNLLYLNLTNNDLEYDCIKSLKPLLISPNLVDLRLANNKLDDNTAEALSAYFYRQICQIKKIDLSSNRITSKGAKILFRSIKQNQSLTHLNLRNNPYLGNGEIAELENFLNNNQCLTHLNLGECGIDSKHVYVITEGLYAKGTENSRCGNNTLHHLNLARNKITDEGAGYIANILRDNTNTGLMMIDLSSNFISDDAASNLASAINTNNYLLKLNLKNNNCMAKCFNNSKSSSIENRLPMIREEMTELLIKEEEQLKAGDKNFNFGKVTRKMEIKKDQIELEMLQYQDCVETMRENDEIELEQLKKMLKNLKGNSEDMDYELIRLAKARDRRKKNLKYQIEDVEADICNVKRTEGDKRQEIYQAKKELQTFQDKVDVHLNKLETELADVELERKRAQFVYENYEREVTRWRKEVEEKKNEALQSNFLQIPNDKGTRRGLSSRRRSRSQSRSRSRSKSKSKCDNEEQKQPFQRIAKRSINYAKENDASRYNQNKLKNNRKHCKSKKSLKRSGRMIKKEKCSNQKLKISVQKPETTKRIY
ncbi:unnamed protein product [Moneuplotes crassus]|uniref:Uncharacterized protein n=1 Tax=Euplotes crassus TaxID=5936 RepID=A0AAD2D5Z4_EUPCR|nr:unnamed protein product [Moneuplotes crassus]